ncbi:paraquat-inducible protein A [Pseudomonas sp.]|uniref:paraquat-inducible protein A n=1 Tax=Pseudomonas sp. TaxID=306 RepID=UPI00260765D7|nr:paraquat-inducible protein A [Pseudomonas sp.]
MKTYPYLIACEHCDTVYQRFAVTSGEVARCRRCSAALYRASLLDVDRWLALTVASAIAFVIANACPVIRISVHGRHNEATLWDAIAALAHSSAFPIAALAAFSIIVAPVLQIALLGWVLGFARVGRRSPGFSQVMRLLIHLRPWCMVEVCMLGTLVAAIKLSSFLQVLPGVGIWGMAVLMALLALIANRDMRWLWDLAAQPQGNGVRA